MFSFGGCHFSFEKSNIFSQIATTTDMLAACGGKSMKFVIRYEFSISPHSPIVSPLHCATKNNPSTPFQSYTRCWYVAHPTPFHPSFSSEPWGTKLHRIWNHC